MDSQRLDLDLHRLELRFAGSRLVEPRAVARIAHSIERCGQIVPCVVVAVSGSPGAGGERLVLIDGYRRIAALRRLGRDTASVEQWTCDLTDALLGLLARTQNRPFASIEEALLIRELMQGLGLSQHDLARRCGRDRDLRPAPRCTEGLVLELEEAHRVLDHAMDTLRDHDAGWMARPPADGGVIHAQRGRGERIAGLALPEA